MEGSSQSTSAAKKNYAKFLEKVGRTIYIDNLSMNVTKAVLSAALGQFGTIVDIQFIPNYTKWSIPQCALVEMESKKDAKSIIEGLQELPFMICGMPRPVRVEPAEAEMFVDRPNPPGRKIVGRWVNPSDPYFESGRLHRRMIRRHAGEAEQLLQQQLEEEEKLHKRQNETLTSNFKKRGTVDSVLHDGSLYRLARLYGVKLEKH
ncbi:ASI1-immunoprecipitated protein 1-like [Aristolochia californica]|uniref:ASI1-immunoprecipitated protein 1-like n=1 Tax=Aristolochia californica TaxID=171875 RepID=UPI0035E0AE87